MSVTPIFYTKKNVAFTWYFFIVDADGDPVPGATALDAEFSLDGGLFADVAGVEVDEGEGLYSVTVTAAECNGTWAALICKTTTAGAKTARAIFRTTVRELDDLAFPNVSGRGIDVDATGGVEITVDQDVNVNKWRGVLANALIAGRVDANSQVVGDKTGYSILAADKDTLVDLVWDELQSGHETTAGTFGRALQVIRSSTAQAGGAATITLDTGASASNDYYNDMLVFITGGTGAGQSRLVTGYVGATKVATVSHAWVTNPDSTSRFILLPSGRVDVATWLSSTVSALQSGRVDATVGAMQAGVITSSAFAAGALNAAAFATDALTDVKLAASLANKIADHVWRRTYANARASANGDAVAFRSGLGLMGKHVNKVAIAAGTLTVYQEDDLTSTAPGGTQAVTVDAAASPIVTLDTN